MDRDFITRPSQLETSGSPLRAFKGVLVNITPHQAQNRTVVDLDFAQVVVTELVPGAVYDYPIAQLNLRYSRKERSGWGKLLKSLEKVGVADLENLKGQLVSMKAHVETYGKDEEGNDIQGLVWEVIALAGGAAAPAAPAGNTTADPVTLAVSLAHGKTSAEFAEAALQNAVLRSSASAIYDGSMLSGLVASGRVVLEGDRYIAPGAPK